MELKDGDNLYCIGNEIIKEEDLKDEQFDYAYYDPIIFNIDENQWLVINFELTQAELIVYEDGSLVSKSLIKDGLLIEAFVKIISDIVEID